MSAVTVNIMEQIPGEVMTWTGGLPLGLYKNVRTFTLSPQAAMTHLRVTDEHTGPLAGLLAEPVPDAQRSFARYVQAVKARAELFGEPEDPRAWIPCPGQHPSRIHPGSYLRSGRDR